MLNMNLFSQNNFDLGFRSDSRMQRSNLILSFSSIREAQTEVTTI
jgi:hypothetical protein